MISTCSTMLKYKKQGRKNSKAKVRKVLQYETIVVILMLHTNRFATHLNDFQKKVPLTIDVFTRQKIGLKKKRIRKE